MMKKMTILTMALLMSLSLVSAQNVGEEAPDFTLTDYNGNEFTLSEQKGKLVFIFVFGNSCPSCLAIGNQTQTQIYEEYMQRDDFVAIGADSWDHSSTNTSVQAFAEHTKIEFPLMVKAGSIETLYSTTYDRLLVIDKEGILRHKGNTAVSADIGNAVSVIDEYLTTTSNAGTSVKNTELSIFPMPARDNVSLRWFNSKAGEATIKIFNATGQLETTFHSGFLTSGSNELNLKVDNLKEGLYFFRLSVGEEVNSGRLIIKR